MPAIVLAAVVTGCTGAAVNRSADRLDTVPLPRVVHELSPLMKLGAEVAAQAEAADLRGLCLGSHPDSFRSTALYDRSHKRWFVVDVEWEPGEGHRVRWFGFATEAGDSADAGEVGERAVCAALHAHRGLEPVPSLVDAHTLECHATGCAASLVRVDAWLWYFDTESVADDVIHAFRPGGREHRIVARRPAVTGAMQGSACASEPEWCRPFRTYAGISAIRRSPDRDSILVQGYRGPPDHAQSGAFHWVISTAR
jgi:hypothetical protein